MANKVIKIAYFIFAVIINMQMVAFPIDCPLPQNKSLKVKLEHSSLGSSKNIENLFKQQLPKNQSVIYTKVPRGLVVSFKSEVFFSENEVELLESSKSILHVIANILKKLSNECIIESHFVNENLKTPYRYNWELTTIRADKIVQYLISEEKINPKKIEAIGFGEMMPFFDNVNSSANLNRRIDFVIINYEKVEPLIKQ